MLYRRKPGEDLHHHKPRLMKYYFGDCWQIRPLVWNMSANSKGRLEHVVDLFEICASVAC
jgi:hypothetical protein